MTRLSQNRIDQIRSDYSAGMPIKDIMLNNGVSRATVSRVTFNMEKRYPNMSVPKISPDVVDKMKAMRTEGCSNSMIAKELGISYDTVRCYLGTQPANCRADYGSIVAHVTDVKPEEVKIEAPKQTPVLKTELKLKNVVYSYAGQHYEYKVRTDTNVVRIVDNGVNFDIPSKDFETFVLELVELYSELTSKKITMN